MSLLKDINTFTQHKTIAVVGVSRDGKKFGNLVYKELRSKGYKVFAVNPNTDSAEGDPCYSQLSTLPEKVDAVLVTTKRDQSLSLVQQAQQLNIQNVWLHSGAISQDAVDYCQTHGITCIPGQCILMYVDPVTFPHNIHRGISRIFGKYPK